MSLDRAMISKAQVRAIRARQHTMGMDDDTYRQLLGEHYRVTSTLQLTRKQANALMRQLYGRALPKPRPRRRARPDASAADPGVVHLASGPQRRLITALINEIDWRENDGFSRWLHQSMGLRLVRSAGEAQKVINGLMGLKQHGHARAP